MRARWRPLCVDAVASYPRYDLDVTGADGAFGSTHANGWAVSGEVGKGFVLSDRFTLTPQAQLTWQSIDIAGYRDSAGLDTASSNADSLEGRLGARLGWDAAAGTRLYAQAGLAHEFLESPIATVAGTALSPGLSDSFYVLGGGVQWQNPLRTMGLWAEGDYRGAFNGSLDKWQATAGVKMGL